MDEIVSIPPFLPLLLAGLALPLLPQIGRQVLLVAAPLLALIAVLMLRPEHSFALPILNASPVHFLSLENYAPVFGAAFCVLMLGAGIFGINTAKRGEAAAALIAGSAALGVVFAGDMISFFLFWELLAVASAYLIFAGGFKASAGAARRYLILHLFGGACLLAGISGVIVDSGTATFPVLALSLPLPAWSDLPAWSPWLIFIGVMVNLAAPPFSAWLPDSYPEASPFGMVVLSGLTTKAAIFVLIELFANNSLLIWVGAAMMIYGTLYAFMENDMRRMLAYSIVAQCGAMVTATGIGTAEALAGTALLAFGHVAYKGLLVTAAGSIMQQSGKRRFSDLGGLWRETPAVFAATLVGAFAMAGLPATGAFVGKSLIHHAVASLDVAYIYLLFVTGIAGATFLIFPWFVFGGGKKSVTLKAPSAEAKVALGFFAAAILIPGIFPSLLAGLLPQGLSDSGYHAASVLHAFELAAFGALGFFLLLPWLKHPKGVLLDMDWLYRGFGLHVLRLMNQLMLSMERVAAESSRRGLSRAGGWMSHFFAPAGIIADAWPIGLTVLAATALLSLLLFVYY